MSEQKNVNAQVVTEPPKKEEIKNEEVNITEQKNKELKAEEIVTGPPKKEEIKNKNDQLNISEQKNEELKAEEIVTGSPKKEEIEIKEGNLQISEQVNKEIKAQEVIEPSKIEEIKNKNDNLNISEQKNEVKAQEVTEPSKKEETENKEDKLEISKQKNEVELQEVTNPSKNEEIENKQDKQQISEQKNEEVNAQKIVPELPKIEEIGNKEESSNTSNDVQKLLQEKDLELVLLQFQNNEMNEKLNKLDRDLEARTEERENYKNKIDSLESEIAELKKQQPNTLTPVQQNEIEKIKKRSEDMLTKAKGIIFEKTKICKNQELQIEALSQQVSSLKDVLSITKDLLEIRNMEVKHLQEKMECMDVKIGAERHRQDLLHKKMEAITEMNATLKEEYAKQLVLFQEMRNKYENDN